MPCSEEIKQKVSFKPHSSQQEDFRRLSTGFNGNWIGCKDALSAVIGIKQRDWIWHLIKITCQMAALKKGKGKAEVLHSTVYCTVQVQMKCPSEGLVLCTWYSTAFSQVLGNGAVQGLHVLLDVSTCTQHPGRLLTVAVYVGVHSINHGAPCIQTYTSEWRNNNTTLLYSSFHLTRTECSLTCTPPC